MKEDGVFKKLEDLIQAYDKGWVSLEFYLNERDRLERIETARRKAHEKGDS